MARGQSRDQSNLFALQQEGTRRRLTLRSELHGEQDEHLHC